MTVRTLVLPRARTLGAVLAFAIAAALAAQVAIPIPSTPVPLALAPMVVVLAGLWLGPTAGAASMALYVAAGAVGLPVFAPIGAPGILRLAGPTGGYLLAYPAAAALAGWLARRAPGTLGRIAAAVAGMIAIHVGGVAQLTILTGSPAQALALGSVPFALAAAAKAIVAGLLPVRRAA